MKKLMIIGVANIPMQKRITTIQIGLCAARQPRTVKTNAVCEVWP